MRAAGLLSLDLPADFAVPDPNALGADEDPLDEGDTVEFHTDFLGEENRLGKLRWECRVAYA